MAFSLGRSVISLEEVLKRVSEADIAARYLGILEIPCVICSPLREDNKPSFGLYSHDGKRIHFTDFATGERGGLFDLLSQMWHIPYQEVLEKIIKDLDGNSANINVNKSEKSAKISHKIHSEIKVKTREWNRNDIKYWKSYGISLDWLKYADVYPISHKFIIKGNKTYTFGADKYAYAFVEKKEGNITIKIYQPFNKNGFKWSTSTDRSVISLWTKVPEYGDKLCICSSLKDALCLWENTGIPAVATQGEGYVMSNTAITELKRRFKKVYVFFDNDEPGIINGQKLSKATGFTNIVLPQFDGGKDISDLYFTLQDKEKFKEVILPLFTNH